MYYVFTGEALNFILVNQLIIGEFDQCFYVNAYRKCLP
ncbi:hypothetical protein GPAL_2823 [Glaciecola pallidula DSM 14239 = ACAM 615]|uniref:Uncharacterized protein n=1 Tax=Brumicola pallidula DSM 14239 = ACAM 615 TaxID=1121922 RepID=K6YA96_9ALTE|nr:hypothetical protein GPAL_2823 [Glaciecola pallidula DSM 14239 = ACAM 615]